MGSTGTTAGPVTTSNRSDTATRGNLSTRQAMNRALDAISTGLGNKWTDEERTKIVNDVLGDPKAPNIVGYLNIVNWAREHGGKRRFSNLK